MKHLYCAILAGFLAGCASEQEKMQQAAVIQQYCMGEAQARTSCVPIVNSAAECNAQYVQYYHLCAQRHGYEVRK